MLDLSDYDLHGLVHNRRSRLGDSLLVHHPTAVSHELGLLADRAAEVSALRAWLREVSAGPRAFHLAACGGDGTVNLVAEALMGLPVEQRDRVLLGGIGLGSSNDFHKPYDRPGGCLREGLPLRLDFAAARSADLIRVRRLEPDTGRWIDAYAVNNASVGLTAFGNRRFEQPSWWRGFLRRRLTGLAIRVTAIETLFLAPAYEVTLTLDGVPRPEMRLCNLAVLLNPHVTGTVRYPRGGGGGELQVYLSAGSSLATKVRTFAGLERGRFPALPGNEAFRVKTLTVRSAQGFPLEFDGEVSTSAEVVFTCLPEVLRLCQ